MAFARKCAEVWLRDLRGPCRRVSRTQPTQPWILLDTALQKCEIPYLLQQHGFRDGLEALRIQTHPKCESALLRLSCPTARMLV